FVLTRAPAGSPASSRTRALSGLPCSPGHSSGSKGASVSDGNRRPAPAAVPRGRGASSMLRPPGAPVTREAGPDAKPPPPGCSTPAILPRITVHEWDKMVKTPVFQGVFAFPVTPVAPGNPSQRVSTGVRKKYRSYLRYHQPPARHRDEAGRPQAPE